MPRNIDRRVEVLFPVQDTQMVHHLKEEVLDVYLKDNLKARRMLPDGSYTRVKPGEKETPFNSQDWFINRHQQLAKEQA
jgi:polyphosphate kinase